MSKIQELAYPPEVGFQSRKAAQIAAFFVAQSDGLIDKMKLAKLQYLSEREFLGRHGRPMVYDELYSLPHGPICSSALNGIEGKLGDADGWDAVKANGKKEIHGSKTVSRADLDDVSDAEFDVLQAVWKQFGKMTAGEVRKWTHDKRNCPEYTEVMAARIRISYEEILRAVGSSKPVELASDIHEVRRLELAFQR